MKIEIGNWITIGQQEEQYEVIKMDGSGSIWFKIPNGIGQTAECVISKVSTTKVEPPKKPRKNAKTK
jgi:hypothetical protein